MAWTGGGSYLGLPTAVGDVFQVPTPPTPTTGNVALLQPNFTVGPVGKDPYRAWTMARLLGLAFFANGFDQPWYWDGSGNFYDMGSDVPTSFNLAEDAVGSTFPTGTTLDYRLTYRNSSLKKETAPQSESITIAAASADVTVSWTDPGGEFDKVGIYRRLDGDSLYVLVSEEDANSSPYTDQTDNATLLLGTTFLEERLRQTKPPVFSGIIEHQNRLWGWTGEDSILYFSQTASTSLNGEFLLDDFPSANFVEIAAWDGDEIVTVVEFYSVLYVFKRRAVYVLAGSNPSNFRVERLFADRGCVSRRGAVHAHGLVFFLDEQGLHFTDLRGEPFPAGAAGGTQESPLAATWERLNRDALDQCWIFHNEEEGLLECHVALDHAPEPRTVVVYDLRFARYTSIDSGVPSFSGGYVDDAAGVQRAVGLDELNHLWQRRVGNSEGVYAGDTTADLTSAGGDQQLLTAAGATFSIDQEDGGEGATLDRYNSAGDVVDFNRCAAISTTTITPLRWSSVSPLITDMVAIGVIPWNATFSKPDFQTVEEKNIPAVRVQTTVESGGLVRVDTSMDQRAFRNQKEFNLSLEKGAHRVKCDDRGFRWQIRFVARYAGLTINVLGLDVEVESVFVQE